MVRPPPEPLPPAVLINPSVSAGRAAGTAMAAAIATAPRRRPLRASESVSASPLWRADGPADRPHRVTRLRDSATSRARKPMAGGTNQTHDQPSRTTDAATAYITA